MNKYIVYAHINNLNKKAYIGITSKTIDERSGNNGKKYLRKVNGHYKHPKFANAILKYGWVAFDHIILLENLDLKSAKIEEKKMIIKYNSFNNGYNSTTGGDSTELSPESIERIRIANTGKKQSNEFKNFMSKRMCGFNHPMYGKKFSDKERKNISEKTKAAMQRKDVINKIRTHLSSGAYSKKKVAKTDSNFNIIMIYESASQAARENGLKNCSQIVRCCKDHKKTSSGYHWIYA